MLSETETAAIQELRSKIEPELINGSLCDTDLCLLRWLQGFNFDITVVLKKFRAHLRLRKAWDLDNILSSQEEKTITWKYYFGQKVPGNTVAGDELLFIENLGRIDAVGLLKTVSIIDLIRNRVYWNEMIFQSIVATEKETGRQTKLLCVLDMDGVDISAENIRLAMGPLPMLSSFISDNYIEMMGRIIVINSGSIIFYLWKLVKPLLPKETAEKVVILGSDWKKKILEYIPKETLPVHYGGSNNLEVKFPQKVPANLFWPFDKPKFNQDPEIIYIQPKKQHFVTREVTTPNSRLHMTFIMESDCSMGGFFSEYEDDEDIDQMEMVFPQFLVFPGLSNIPVSETIVCEKPGFYKIWFKNGASWVRSIKLQIVLQIEKPA